MKSNRLFAFSLPGLAALLVVIPYTRPASTPNTRPASTPSVQPAAHVQSVPCSDTHLAQFSASASSVEKFTNGPLPFSLEMSSITGSCWMSQDNMISWNGNHLTVFNRITQQATLIAGTEAAFSGKHWASIVSLSPDSHWLVWASGEDGHSTWEAITTDGTEHRQWPRDESIDTPAVAWMQDSIHWVELRCPETKVDADRWRVDRNNLRARVYSIDTPVVEDQPLRLETPDPAFSLPCICGTLSEFIFTKDGHAWLSEIWQSASTPQGEGSREDVYELVPGPHIWTLHKSCVYPVSDDSKRWMFDAPRRSPDGNWIAWRNYAPTGKDKPRLMLSRTDGSEMQELYQSDTLSGVEPQWSPDSRQIAFTDNGPLGIVTLKMDQFMSQEPSCSPGKAVARVLPPGKFPVSHPGTLLAGRPHPPTVFHLCP